MCKVIDECTGIYLYGLAQCKSLFVRDQNFVNFVVFFLSTCEHNFPSSVR